jgi:hypothetical protein
VGGWHGLPAQRSTTKVAHACRRRTRPSSGSTGFAVVSSWPGDGGSTASAFAGPQEAMTAPAPASPTKTASIHLPRPRPVRSGARALARAGDNRCPNAADAASGAGSSANHTRRSPWRSESEEEAREIRERYPGTLGPMWSGGICCRPKTDRSHNESRSSALDPPCAPRRFLRRVGRNGTSRRRHVRTRRLRVRHRRVGNRRPRIRWRGSLE